MHVFGKCFCGDITYESDIDPSAVVICHCKDCQELSGSAFEVVAVTSDESFHLVSGDPRLYTKTADSGKRRQLAFCPRCGTRLYGRQDSGERGSIALRVGTIEQRDQLSPQLQIWCRSALPWAIIDSLPKVDRQAG